MKNNLYNASEIEPKWQKIWEDTRAYSMDIDTMKKPFYNLMMFPYPSAEGMHVGNMYAFTGADIYGRFMRMKGFDVFEPIGLDGFGIHSENYAIKVGRHPKEQAKISEKNFYRQLHSIGNGFDWSRKLETYDSSYYKWTQWLFIQLFKAGLAYRKKADVNFCPSDKTVLADEQVVDGKCERCGSIVEKKELEQWFFRITKYADRLLSNIEKLNWTEKVKIAQRNWIGKSEGARISFPVIASVSEAISNSNGIATSPTAPRNDKLFIEVFTTRPDTLYGATFLVLSPEHPIVSVILNSFQNLERSKIPKQVRDDIEKYLQEAKRKTEQERMAEGREKTGVFTGLYAINPVNDEKIPIWIADYVLIGYGTGAIMAVPAHDQRDFEFAKKYKLSIKNVIARNVMTKQSKSAEIATLPSVARNDKGMQAAYIGEGMIINSRGWDGWKAPQSIVKVIDWIEKKRIGKRQVQYHLRDWLISRQRYWGPPIPLVFCENCAVKIKDQRSKIKDEEYTKGEIENPGWIAVREKDLPVLLPDVKDWKPTGSGKSPLANVESFVNTFCPNCHMPAKRETDVSDTFLDSAWYFFRYVSTDIDSIAFDIKRVKKWLPVEMYIGGAEHSVLHLLYSRFITMVLKDLGLIEFEEPFSRFYAHGLLIKEGAKMSKSKGNVVIPDEYIKKYGADTLRCYLMFLGPFNQGGDFYDTGIEGVYRFIKRVWSLVSSIKYQVLNTDDGKENINLDRVMHKTIQKVTEDIEHLRYNTAIAHIMEYYNSFHSFYTKYKILNTKYCKTLALLLAPFAPHVTEELYHNVILNKAKDSTNKEGDSSSRQGGTQNDKKGSIHLQPWPTYDTKFLEEDEVTIVVQVNGKVRDTIKIQKSIPDSIGDKSQKYVEELARKSDKIRKYLQEKEVKRVVYVEGKIINFVTE